MSPSDIDNLIERITTKLVEVGDILPKAKFKNHVRPFWNNSLPEFKRARVTAYRNWKLGGSNKDSTNINFINHKNAKRAFRREIKKVQRDYEKRQVHELINSAECDRNRFWKLVKSARLTKQSNTPVQSLIF